MIEELLTPRICWDWRMLNLYFQILIHDQNDCKRLQPERIMAKSRISAIPWDYVDVNGIQASEAEDLSKSETLYEDLFTKRNGSISEFDLKWVTVSVCINIHIMFCQCVLVNYIFRNVQTPSVNFNKWCSNVLKIRSLIF